MYNLVNVIFFDSIGFQTPATPIMEGIIDLHNYIFIFLIGVLTFVLISFMYIIIYYYMIPTNMYTLETEKHSRKLESFMLTLYKKENESMLKIKSEFGITLDTYSGLFFFIFLYRIII